MHDAAFGEFRRQLAYKAEWNCKEFVAVGRFFPSSRMCRDCGRINERLTLFDRIWVCDGCGAVHDREVNAAGNIFDEGWRLLAAGHAERLNAHGAGVRPATCGHSALN
jgi:putative transposase